VRENINEFDFETVWAFSKNANAAFQKRDSNLVSFMTGAVSTKEIYDKLYECEVCLKEQFPFFEDDKFNPVYNEHSPVKWILEELPKLAEEYGKKLEVKTLVEWKNENPYSVSATNRKGPALRFAGQSL
jgi:hypothetical protein